MSRLAKRRELLPVSVMVVFVGKVLRLSDRLGKMGPDKLIKLSEDQNIMSFMKAYENQTYALMRITTGFLYFCHGATKFMNMPDDRPMHIQWVAGPVELIGGALVMLGLYVSPAAFICSGVAAAAYWMAHFSAENYLPIMNRGDAAALYAFAFLYISAKGTGIWGIGKD